MGKLKLAAVGLWLTTLSCGCHGASMRRRQLVESDEGSSSMQHADYDILPQCSTIKPVIHMSHMHNPILRSHYMEAMEDMERRYLHALRPGTLQEPIYETLWEGNLCLWGFLDLGTLDLTVYNDEERLMGVTQVAGNIWNFVIPRHKDFSTIRQKLTFQGDHITFLGRRFGVFGHIFIDNIGYIAYLRDTAPSTVRFLLADSKDQLGQRILEILDPEFAARVDWIHCENEKDCNAVAHIRNGNLTVLRPRSMTNHMDLLFRARKWILEKNPPSEESLTHRTIVFYTRNSKNAYHGRVMDPQQEQLMLAMVEAYMKQHNRTEKLVIFDGSGTIEEQIRLFQSANIVIGPHGSGFANLMFLLPAYTCRARPKVLEFITNPLTPDVQEGEFQRTFYNEFSTTPWVEYHHLFIIPPSDASRMFVDLQDFGHALQLIMSEQEPYTAIS